MPTPTTPQPTDPWYTSPERARQISELQRMLHTVADAITTTCQRHTLDILTQGMSVVVTLLQKNQEYGNSALDPVRVFSKAPTDEQIKVRIDDKLSRIARGKGNTEDTVLDLLGYLVLLRCATALHEPTNIPTPTHPLANG